LHWPEAVESLRAATTLDSSDIEIWKVFATAARAAGNIEEATRAGQMAAALAQAPPASEPARGGDAVDRNLAEAFARARRGRVAEAIEILDIEVELAAANDPRPLIARGVLLLQLGRGEDALRSAEAALARAPELPEALHLRGAVLMGRRDFAGAERDLRAALERRADFAPALGDLGILLLDQNRAAEAVPFFERLAAMQPQDEAVRRNLAEARRRSSG
jgi:Flp pilus assembly protein TadD